MSSSSEVLVESKIADIARIVEELAKHDHCGLCGQTQEGEEFVDFCDCKVGTQKIHLACIKLLETTHNGYLRCLNRDCNRRFNQYIGDTELHYRNRLLFEKRYPVTFLCVFLFTVISQVQMFLFVHAYRTMSNSTLIPAVVVHFIAVLSHAITMIALYEVTARQVFAKFFRRTRAITVLQYTISCTLLVSIFNILPLFTVKAVFNMSLPMAVWLIVYWTCFSPSIGWLVLRKNIHELREVENLKFTLKFADVQTPTTFNA